MGLGVMAMKRMLLVLLVAAGMMLAGCGGDVLSLDVGACFDDPEAFDLVDSSDVEVVDCDVPHDNEVFANQDLTGDEYPGTEAVANRADQVCLDDFDTYIGQSYDASIYEFSWFVPSEESWEVGDREVICFAYDLNFEKITGSVNGIGK